MHVLLTRPHSQSLEMKSQLEMLGFRVSIEPVLEISFINHNKHIYKSSKAFIVTSVHASSQVASSGEADPSIPIYSIGPATSRPLRDAGFTRIYEGTGTAEDLLKLILKKAHPSDGLITYLSGWHVMQDIAKALAISGYKAQRVVTYKATPRDKLTEATRELLVNRQLDCGVFMSYRSAYYFSMLCKDASLALYFTMMEAIALSSGVAQGLSSLKWRKIAIAKRPSSKSLIDMLEVARNNGFNARVKTRSTFDKKTNLSLKT